MEEGGGSLRRAEYRIYCDKKLCRLVLFRCQLAHQLKAIRSLQFCVHTNIWITYCRLIPLLNALISVKVLGWFPNALLNLRLGPNIGISE